MLSSLMTKPPEMSLLKRGAGGGILSPPRPSAVKYMSSR